MILRIREARLVWVALALPVFGWAEDKGVVIPGSPMATQVSTCNAFSSASGNS